MNLAAPAHTITTQERRAAREDSWIAGALAAGAFLLYLRTLAPGVLDGDSGEWQYVAPILGIAHSTGYPLYLFLVKVLTLLLPVGSVAYRVNLFSAICAALSVACFYSLARRVTGSRVGACFASALLAVAPTLWASAVEAEVYALNTLLGMLVLWFAWDWHKTESPRSLLLLSIVYGLGLANHRTLAFVAPGILILLFLHWRALNPRTVFLAAVLVLLPLLLYVYIPLRADRLVAEQSPENWALYKRSDAILNGTISSYYEHTPYGFFNLVTAFDNRNKLGAQDTDPSNSYAARAVRSGALLLAQFGWLGLALACAGAVALARRAARGAAVLLGMGAGVAAIGFLLRGESTQFYFSVAYAVLMVCAAAGTGVLWNWVSERLHAHSARRQVLALLGLAAALWIGFVGASNFASMDQSGNRTYERLAQSVLHDDLGQNAVVVATWELATPLRYFQFIENQRPDLLVIHDVPLNSKFWEIQGNAVRLGRPFYWAEFSPEDRLAPAPRYVQAIPLPYVGPPPAPRFKLDKQLGKGIHLFGYTLFPETPQPGQVARIEFWYRADSNIQEEFDAELSLLDGSGREWGDLKARPVTQYLPTYMWKAGQVYRDVWFWTVPTDAPRGIYSAQYSWFNRNAGGAETEVDLPPFGVGTASASDTPPQVSHK